MRLRVSRRTSANINGALIAGGILGSVDNIVIHWIIGLHRAIEDSPYALEAELGLIAISVVLLVVGLKREFAERRSQQRARAGV